MKRSIFLDHIITAASQTGESIEQMIYYVANLGFEGAAPPATPRRF